MSGFHLLLLPAIKRSSEDYRLHSFSIRFFCFLYYRQALFCRYLFSISPAVCAERQLQGTTLRSFQDTLNLTPDLSGMTLNTLTRQFVDSGTVQLINSFLLSKLTSIPKEKFLDRQRYSAHYSSAHALCYFSCMLFSCLSHPNVINSCWSCHGFPDSTRAATACLSWRHNLKTGYHFTRIFANVKSPCYAMRFCASEIRPSGFSMSNRTAWRTRAMLVFDTHSSGLWA